VGHTGGTDRQHPPVSNGQSRQGNGLVNGCWRRYAARRETVRVALLRQQFGPRRSDKWSRRSEVERISEYGICSYPRIPSGRSPGRRCWPGPCLGLICWCPLGLACAKPQHSKCIKNERLRISSDEPIDGDGGGRVPAIAGKNTDLVEHERDKRQGAAQEKLSLEGRSEPWKLGSFSGRRFMGSFMSFIKPPSAPPTTPERSAIRRSSAGSYGISGLAQLGSGFSTPCFCVIQVRAPKQTAAAGRTKARIRTVHLSRSVFTRCCAR
jgi:hypothetical protein